MKSACLLFLVSVFAASLALPQATTTTPPATKKAAPKKTAVSTKTVATKKKTATKNTTRKAAPPAQTWRNRQLAPTKARYQEIQQALADKGYLKQEPNGIWDSQSGEALKAFQTEAKLTPTGKISSQSLISLGLGPKPPEPITAPPAVPEPAATPPASPTPQ
jgi:peptidoglycan hydrolase-like protein with peptidoglycan-binding domain